MWNAPVGLKVRYFMDDPVESKVHEAICEIIDNDEDGISLKLLEDLEASWGKEEAGKIYCHVSGKDIEPFDDVVDQGDFHFRRHKLDE